MYPGTDITIHRLARQWENALHFVGMKYFSRPTFAAHPHRLDILLSSYAYTLMGTLAGEGGGRLVTADPLPLYRSVHG